MMTTLQLLKESLLDLFYPVFCISCESKIENAKELFCLSCQSMVEPTDMYLFKENAFTEHFIGRLPIQTGAALYTYVKSGKIQDAIQLLKYQDRQDIGLRLGRQFGKLLSGSILYQDIDGIIPLPLHAAKEIQRGYNQSALIAHGMAEQMHIPVWENYVQRTRFTETQTNKNRIERVKNMQSAFKLRKSKQFEHKHVLLVDDVLTTGSTLEACGKIILEVPGSRLSIVTLAMGN